MLTPCANWGQSPLLQFPDVWKEQNIKMLQQTGARLDLQLQGIKSMIVPCIFQYCALKNQLTSSVCGGGVLYLVALCWTHLSRAFLAPPCRGGRGFLLTGGLVVSVLLVELSSEEVLLYRAWSAGRLLVSSSILTGQNRKQKNEGRQAQPAFCSLFNLIKREERLFTETRGSAFVALLA